MIRPGPVGLQGESMSISDAMTSAASRLQILDRDKRDDPYIVLIAGIRRIIGNRAAWATSGAAKGAVHRFLKTVRINASALQHRTTRDERTEWIAENVKVMRLSKWKVAK